MMMMTLEVFGEEGHLRHFVDGRGSSSSWMSYVNCARSLSEQNLNMIQTRDGNLFYEVIDDIPCNTELLVRASLIYANVCKYAPLTWPRHIH